MSVYDSAGFDQWGFDRDGTDAGGNKRATEHPGGLRPPARPAVLGPEPANPAAQMHAVHDELVGKVKEKKADHHARLVGRPREGNDPEPPARVGATTSGASATGVAQGGDKPGPGSGGLGGPTFATPAQEEAGTKADTAPSSTTGAKVDKPTDKPAAAKAKAKDKG